MLLIVDFVVFTPTFLSPGPLWICESLTNLIDFIIIIIIIIIRSEKHFLVMGASCLNIIIIIIIIVIIELERYITSVKSNNIYSFAFFVFAFYVIQVSSFFHPSRCTYKKRETNQQSLMNHNKTILFQFSEHMNLILPWKFTWYSFITTEIPVALLSV